MFIFFHVMYCCVWVCYRNRKMIFHVIYRAALRVWPLQFGPSLTTCTAALPHAAAHLPACVWMGVTECVCVCVHSHCVHAGSVYECKHCLSSAVTERLLSREKQMQFIFNVRACCRAAVKPVDLLNIMFSVVLNLQPLCLPVCMSSISLLR